MSGYRLRLNVCSSSCNCCDVKWVRWRRWRLFFLSFFGSSVVIESSAFSCFTCVSFNRDAVEISEWKLGKSSSLLCRGPRATSLWEIESIWNTIWLEKHCRCIKCRKEIFRLEFEANNNFLASSIIKLSMISRLFSVWLYNKNSNRPTINSLFQRR